MRKRNKNEFELDTSMVEKPEPWPLEKIYYENGREIKVYKAGYAIGHNEFEKIKYATIRNA